MEMIFVIYFFYINVNLIYSYITVDSNWEAIKLENGNFLVLSLNGLYILDPTFQVLIYTEDVKKEDEYDFSTIIKQFKREDGSNILILDKCTHYILNSDGNLLYRKTDESSWDKFESSVILYNHLRDVFSYYIICIKRPAIKLYKYSYNSTNDNLEIRDFKLINISEINSIYITCQLMNYLNESVISCFFSTSINYENFINCIAFKAEENFEIIKTSKLKIEKKISDAFKSDVMSTDDRQKVLIIFYIEDNSFLFYARYDINNNNFTYGYLNYKIEYYKDILGSEISYFKETEEFIVSIFIGPYKDYSNVYFIYSINKNFENSFLGILGDFVLGNSLNEIRPFTIYDFKYDFSSYKIVFSSVAQKYSIILNLNFSDIISLFIINKEINIINPTELKSSDSPSNFICENYSDNFQNLLTDNFIEKCSHEIDYMKSNFSWYNFTYKTFEFSFNCSEKYPYEIVETHTCVEYCDVNSLSNGKCILNFKNSNNILETHITDINSNELVDNHSDSVSHEVINTQSDIVSHEVINTQSDIVSHEVK